MAPSVRADPVRDLGPTLSAALADLGLPASADQQLQMLTYVSLLQRWNAVHNLSAARGAVDLLRLHVVDCLAIIGPLRRYASGRRLAVLDAGTGGGLPAVVVAIMEPDWAVTAVDAVSKKVAFVRQAAGEIGLTNLHTRQVRLESLSPNEAGPFDVVTSRAYSSLSRFIEDTRQLIAPDGVWLAMKGKPPDDEIRDLPPNCQLFHVERLTVPGIDADRCLVWLKPALPPA
jgi:16S rRNA (guanine527-N7)-methyltransferase